MKKIKIFLLALVAFALACAVTFTACVLDSPFTNPGDMLGGGGTGEIASEADSSGSDSVKVDISGKSDLNELSKDTSADGASEQTATGEVVEISQSGSYYFRGEYGGIHITGEKLKLHFIFDGAKFTKTDGVAIDGTSNAKKTELVITLSAGSVNTVENGGDDVNAIHIKGSLAINGLGTLNVTSDSKSAIKASKDIRIVDATLYLSAKNHGVTGASVAASNCKVEVSAAGKDGINAECDGATAFTTDDGYVSLTNVRFSCDVDGDGIQADTVVYINGGSYDIKTTGEFVQKTSANMSKYGMVADDFKFIKSGNDYQRIAKDETNRYSSSQLYGLAQSCKAIKVGEIEYEDGGGNTVTVTDGDYLISIMDGNFNIDSTDDAIHVNSGNVLIEGGEFEITTYDDAITSDVLTKITGGVISVGTCYEGIEGCYVEISGGSIDIVSSDDGINAASDDSSVTEHIIISGGDVTVNASGDGIDSNGSILVSGGTVLVYGPTSGADAGLDADRGIVITGGYVFATSTLGMVETPSSNSTQCVVSYAYQTTITAGSTVSLTDGNGNTLFSVEILKNCQSIIFSTPQLQNGGTYSLYGGSTKLTDFTVSSIITTIGNAGSSFPGGIPGGNTPPGGFGGFGGRR